MPQREWDIDTLKARSATFDRVVKLALSWQEKDPEDPKLHELWTAINGHPWDYVEPQKGDARY